MKWAKHRQSKLFREFELYVNVCSDAESLGRKSDIVVTALQVSAKDSPSAVLRLPSVRHGGAARADLERFWGRVGGTVELHPATCSLDCMSAGAPTVATRAEFGAGDIWPTLWEFARHVRLPTHKPRGGSDRWTACSMENRVDNSIGAMTARAGQGQPSSLSIL